ncbi:jg4268 [Pararge aegeria aegeria]|uniref:Jg4268 protein n=1 Tax=Pararge aegeria aegeria TaxID=348720 RepID=A0A8S4QE75_9NEOP|nr:jg4268 [Pararge aegeria aegeria]
MASTTEVRSGSPVQEFPYRRANLPQTTTGASTETSSTTARLGVGSKLTSVNDGASQSVPNSTDLSLAEKSRLSILKKAQRKDDIKNVALTSKPPVLMQVTRRMNTLAMVEPAQKDVILSAREVFDESPDRIGKAKKLMQATSPAASVAQRELKALLGHRQRQEAPRSTQPTPNENYLPSTFPPNAVNPAVDEEWVFFLGANGALKIVQSALYVIALALIIICLQDYR